MIRLDAAQALKQDFSRSTRIPEPVFDAVDTILADLRKDGDISLERYIQKLDGTPKLRVVNPREVPAELDNVLKKSIRTAITNIRTFHQAQVAESKLIETTPGVTCWRESRPIERVGLYIPGGSAPLFSTLLMLAIPAKIAGCKEIVVCTPPNEGSIHPAIAFCAAELEIDKVYLVGGAQAIAAMAYGTQTIPKVDKVFGPGNAYVTAAKMRIQQEGTAIDMPAGPSEVAIIADELADPEFIAADLLSQAEHGADSEVYLLATDRDLIKRVEAAIDHQLPKLARRSMAEEALKHSFFIHGDMDSLLSVSNQIAPEHLILNMKDSQQILDQVVNAGSVFVGPLSAESIGDYASGTNHTLPTNGGAKAYSGVSVDSFVKHVTFQRISPEGLSEIGPAVEAMAAAEGLDAHKYAVSVRLSTLL